MRGETGVLVEKNCGKSRCMSIPLSMTGAINVQKRVAGIVACYAWSAFVALVLPTSRGLEAGGT